MMNAIGLVAILAAIGLHSGGAIPSGGAWGIGIVGFLFLCSEPA